MPSPLPLRPLPPYLSLFFFFLIFLLLLLYISSHVLHLTTFIFMFHVCFLHVLVLAGLVPVIFTFSLSLFRFDSPNSSSFGPLPYIRSPSLPSLISLIFYPHFHFSFP